MVWPAATEKKQVKAQQRMQAMLHHDKMPEGKHVKYLQHGPRPSRSEAAEHRPASHETANDISSQAPGTSPKSQTRSKGSSSWLVEEEVAV
jgi:hypothetical protein